MKIKLFLACRGEKVKERKILLDEIDSTKETMSEVIGVPEIEWASSLNEVYASYPSEILEKKLKEKLGFSVTEILEVLSNTPLASEAIAILWKRKGRKEISLQEYAQTYVLLLKIGMKYYPEKKETLSER